MGTNEGKGEISALVGGGDYSDDQRGRTIFFVQRQQKSISASIPAMRDCDAFFNFYLGRLSF